MITEWELFLVNDMNRYHENKISSSYGVMLMHRKKIATFVPTSALKSAEVTQAQFHIREIMGSLLLH
jgi:hypothetical protein